MSSCITPVAAIEDVRPHPNADRLDLAQIQGWQVVVGRGTYRPGDFVLYVPPDTLVPHSLAQEWGVSPYLSSGNRVRSIKIRGEVSHGFTVNLDKIPLAIPFSAGMNLAEDLGLTKYEPPEKFWRAGPSPFAPDLDAFPKYTDIENLRHYPDLLVENEEVWLTEKIHGTNCRVGMVNGELVVGTRRRRLLGPDSPSYYQDNVYWWVSEVPGVKLLLRDLGRLYTQVVLYGEVYGPKIQSLTYGAEKPEFCAFDLYLDGRYLDWDCFEDLMEDYIVPTVPCYGRVCYTSIDIVKRYAEGVTALDADHISEGVVVRPRFERRHPTVGRMIFKYVSDRFLTGNLDDGSR